MASRNLPWRPSAKASSRAAMYASDRGSWTWVGVAPGGSVSGPPQEIMTRIGMVMAAKPALLRYVTQFKGMHLLENHKSIMSPKSFFVSIAR